MPSLMISPFQMASAVNGPGETNYNLSNQEEELTRGEKPTGNDVTSSQISNIDQRGAGNQDTSISPFGVSARHMVHVQ